MRNWFISICVSILSSLPCFAQPDVSINVAGVWQNGEYGIRNNDDQFFLYPGLGLDTSQPLSYKHGVRPGESAFYFKIGVNGSYTFYENLAAFAELRYMWDLGSSPVSQLALIRDYAFNYDARLRESHQQYTELYFGPRGILPIGESAQWLLSAGPVLSWFANERSYEISPLYSEDNLSQTIRRSGLNIGWQGSIHHQANWNEHFGHRLGIEVFGAKITPDQLEIISYKVNGTSQLDQYDPSRLKHNFNNDSNDDVKKEEYSILRLSLSFMLTYQF